MSNDCSHPGLYRDHFGVLQCVGCDLVVTESNQDKFGTHLRKAIKGLRAAPRSEHRQVCKCKRCRKAKGC